MFTYLSTHCETLVNLERGLTDGKDHNLFEFKQIDGMMCKIVKCNVNSTLHSSPS